VAGRSRPSRSLSSLCRADPAGLLTQPVPWSRIMFVPIVHAHHLFVEGSLGLDSLFSSQETCMQVCVPVLFSSSPAAPCASHAALYHPPGSRVVPSSPGQPALTRRRRPRRSALHPMRGLRASLGLLLVVLVPRPVPPSPRPLPDVHSGWHLFLSAPTRSLHGPRPLSLVVSSTASGSLRASLARSRANSGARLTVRCPSWPTQAGTPAAAA
jgi:hypothetical protein